MKLPKMAVMFFLLASLFVVKNVHAESCDNDVYHGPTLPPDPWDGVY